MYPPSGTGEAGKSTFIKQMRIIHGQGYSVKDRAEFKELVYKNVYTAIEILVEAMRALKIPYQVASNQVRTPHPVCADLLVRQVLPSFLRVAGRS